MADCPIEPCPCASLDPRLRWSEAAPSPAPGERAVHCILMGGSPRSSSWLCLSNAVAVDGGCREQLLKDAKKVEESLAIERELARVALEIDTIEGRMKYLREHAAF